MSDRIVRGDCFKIEDPSGVVYRRVRNLEGAAVHCHVFGVWFDRTRVMHPGQEIGREALLRQTRITDDEWNSAWNIWLSFVGELWHVE